MFVPTARLESIDNQVWYKNEHLQVQLRSAGSAVDLQIRVALGYIVTCKMNILGFPARLGHFFPLKRPVIS